MGAAGEAFKALMDMVLGIELPATSTTVTNLRTRLLAGLSSLGAIVQPLLSLGIGPNATTPQIFSLQVQRNAADSLTLFLIENITPGGFSGFGAAQDVITGDGEAFVQMSYQNSGNPDTRFENLSNAGVVRTGFDAVNGLLIWTEAVDAPIRFAVDGGAAGVPFTKEVFRLVSDANIPDGSVGMLVKRNLAGVFTLQQVSMGAADSGGAGFRLLRVPN